MYLKCKKVKYGIIEIKRGIKMKKLLTILTIIIILISPKSVLADNREYFIDNLNINAQILANGDVVVNEILQYLSLIHISEPTRPY